MEEPLLSYPQEQSVYQRAPVFYRKASEPFPLGRKSRRFSLKQGPLESRVFGRKVTRQKAGHDSPRSKKWKFKLWANIAILLRRACEELIEKGRRTDNNPFYSQIESCDPVESKPDKKNEREDTQYYPIFNPADFKANTQMRLSREAKRILMKPSEERTDDEIHYAMMALSGLKLISEYPIRMQRNLAQFGYFKRYSPRRIVVKEGKRPECFYFIIYGKVLVAVLQTSGYAETKVELSSGRSFGELAIVNGSNRQSSVVTKTYTEFLSISDEVYVKIFMVGGAKHIKDPDQENFLRSLNFLQGWPIELFEKYDPKNFTFSYFKRNTVIVRNSNLSDWIFIVKSGSITVLKKLVKVRHTLNRSRSRISTKSPLDRYLAFQERDNDYWIYSLSKLDQYDSSTDFTDDDSFSSYSVQSRPYTCQTYPKVNRRRRNARVSQSAGMVKVSSSQQLHKIKQPQIKSVTDLPRLKPSFISALGNLTENEENDAFCRNIRTHIDDLNAAYKAKEHFETEADLNPQFVHIQKLTNGDVFGLSQILFEDQPSLSLVSNGSECMLLKKKFFLDNCPRDVILRLRREVPPYPSDAMLQQELQRKVNWEVYKLTLRKELLSVLPHRCHVLAETPPELSQSHSVQFDASTNSNRSYSVQCVKSSQSTISGRC